jgi:hypothetical protein
MDLSIKAGNSKVYITPWAYGTYTNRHATPRQQGGLGLSLGSLRRFLPLPGE